MSIQIEHVPYGGWDDCLRLSDGVAELIIPTQVGIRIIRYGLIGGNNVFAEVADDMGKTGEDIWRIYGGHRLWHAPEHPERTYAPDNVPVAVETVNETTVRITQQNDDPSGLHKQVEVEMLGEGRVQVTHRLTNYNLWAVMTAPWSLSVMTTGGTAIIPLPPRGSHENELLPNTRLILWAYTDLSDSRWQFGREYLMLKQDVTAPNPQKIGTLNTAGWLAYVNDDVTFIKTFDKAQNDITYPDMGVNCELFTNDWMLELESLGAMQSLDAGASIEHVETWSLHQDIAIPSSDDDIKATILPLIN